MVCDLFDAAKKDDWWDGINQEQQKVTGAKVFHVET